MTGTGGDYDLFARWVDGLLGEFTRIYDDLNSVRFRVQSSSSFDGCPDVDEGLRSELETKLEAINPAWEELWSKVADAEIETVRIQRQVLKRSAPTVSPRPVNQPEAALAEPTPAPAEPVAVPAPPSPPANNPPPSPPTVSSVVVPVGPTGGDGGSGRGTFGVDGPFTVVFPTAEQLETALTAYLDGAAIEVSGSLSDLAGDASHLEPFHQVLADYTVHVSDPGPPVSGLADYDSETSPPVLLPIPKELADAVVSVHVEPFALDFVTDESKVTAYWRPGYENRVLVEMRQPSNKSKKVVIDAGDPFEWTVAQLHRATGFEHNDTIERFYDADTYAAIAAAAMISQDQP